MTDYDYTPLGSINYDQSKVPAEIKKHADYVRTKAYGIDVREAQARADEITGIIASEAVGISNTTKGRQNDLENTFDSLKQEITNKDIISAPEIIAARGGLPQLEDRLDATDAQLAQIEKKVTINTETRFSLGGSKVTGTKLSKNIMYNAPSEFNWQNHPLLRRVYTDGKGNFDTDFDVSELAPTGKKYYVSFDGDSSNDGLTPETSLNSLYAALQKTDVKEIILASGYYGDNSFNNVAISKSVSIKAAEGADVTISSTRIGLPWTKTEGYTNVYQTQRSLVTRTFDKKYKDENNDWIELIAKSSIAEVNATQGSFFVNGSTVYVHTKNSRPADGDVVPFMDMYNFYINSGVTVYVENIKIEGGKYPVYLRNETTEEALFLAKNCTFKYSSENGSDGISNYGCTSILQNCTSAKNSDDGFSYTSYGSRPTLGIEIECIGRHNGAVGGNDNGTTAHDGANIIRINSAYYQNRGPSLADVGGSHSWNLGCLIAEAHGTLNQASNRGAVSAGNNGVTGTKVWLDGCTLYGSTPDIHTDVDNHTYVRNTNYITSNELEVAY